MMEKLDGKSLVIGSISSILIIISLRYLKRIFSVYCSNVDTKSTHHGGMLVAETLKSHGVTHIFTLCGGHISPILVAAEKLDIHVIGVRNEATAVFAADASVRSGKGGKFGVAAVTAGPGFTNTITALKNAQMAEIPLLLISGAAATALKGRGSLQDIDQMSVVRSLVKHAVSITRVRDIVPEMRRAIQLAQSDTPGPVFLELPIDSLYPYHLVRPQMGIHPAPRSIKQRIVNLYLEFYLRNLFGGAFSRTGSNHSDFKPLPIAAVSANHTQIITARQLIGQANKPLILIGSQALYPPDVAPASLVASIELINIPCYLGGMARGLLGGQHRLLLRQNRKEALQEADLIILAGAVCDFRLGYGKSLNRRARIIVINRNKTILLMNSDMFWRASLAIQADVAETLAAISSGMDSQSAVSSLSIGEPIKWLLELQAREQQKNEANAKKATVPTKVHLNPLQLLIDLDSSESLFDPARSVLVADGGDFVGSAAYLLRPRGPLGWLDPGVFGTLGVGGGFALGVKCVRPEADVWIIYGDGSLGYSLIEFETFARYKLGVIAVVGNDACWSQIAREQVPMFGSNVGCGLQYTEYHKAAEGLGGRGFVITRETDADHTQEIFQEALKLSRQGIPVLINCLIGQSDFRQGSISV